MSRIRPILEGERVVAYPYTSTAGGWTYLMPRGTVIKRRTDAIVVELDDGSIYETGEENLRRAKGWRQPGGSARRSTRSAPPLPEGWEQPSLDL